MVPFSRDFMRGLRDGQGFTRDALAIRVGCSPETIKAWESGRSQPSGRYHHALADALGVHPDELNREETDATSDYIGGVLYRARPLTDAQLDAAARVLRRARAERRSVPAPDAA